MSIQPQDAPYRPAYIRDAAGLYWRIGGGGTSGGGGLDQDTTDLLYVSKTSEADQYMVAGLDVGGMLSTTSSIYAGGGITVEQQVNGAQGASFGGVVNITNNVDKTVTPLVVNRGITSTSTSDADIFSVNYLGTRSTWVNEKGNLRTSNAVAKGEVAMKIIAASTAEGGTGNMMEVLDIAGNIQTRIGPLGRQNFNKGIRMVGDTIEIRDSTEADTSTISQALGGPLLIAPKTSLSVNSKKITSLADGTVASDAAAYGQVSVKANSASPTLTGTPLSTTAAVDTNTTQIATTAFVVGQASGSNPVMNGAVAQGTSLRYSRQDHVHPVDTSRAAASHTHVIGDLPTGTSGTTVALGNHLHTGTYLPIVGGTLTGALTTQGNMLIGTSVYYGANYTGIELTGKGAFTIGTAAGDKNIYVASLDAAGGVILEPGNTMSKAATFAIDKVTFTTPLHLPADPTVALQATTKQYVDARTPVIVKSTTAPTDLTAVWVDIN